MILVLIGIIIGIMILRTFTRRHFFDCLEIDLKQEQGNCRPSSVSNIVHRKVKKKRSNLKQIFILSRDDQAIVRHDKNASITSA